MKKKLMRLSLPHMRARALTMALTNCAIGAVPVLLWIRYVDDAARPPSLVMSVVGVIYAAIAWVCYLMLDGFSPLPAGKKARDNELQRTKRAAGGGMLDHVYTPPEKDESERDDRLLCRLAAFSAVALIYLVPTLFM